MVNRFFPFAAGAAVSRERLRRCGFVGLWLGWLCLFGPIGHAAETPGWTRFRGPDGAGLSPAQGLPATWSNADFAWRVKLPGTGHSSPVVWGDRVFVTSGVESNALRIVSCLSSADGRVLWRRDFASTPHRKHRDNNYASPSPAVDARRVYLYWTTPDAVTVLALKHDGQEAWRRNLGPFAGSHGGGASPIVEGDRVIINNDQDGKSFLVALDSATGQTRWQTDRRSDRVAYATPIVFQAVDGPRQLVFSSSSHGLTGVAPADGRMLWEFTNAFPFRVVGSPVVADQLIVATCGEGGVGKRLVAVRPGSEASPPQLVYELKTAIPYVPTPLSQGGRLFLWGDNGLVRCVRAATGEPVWQEKLEDAFYGSPVGIAGRLYAIAKSGVVYVVAAAERFELLGRTALGEASFATPAVADGVLYLRTETQLFAVGSRAPERRSDGFR